MVSYGQNVKTLDMNEKAEGFRQLYEEAVWQEEQSAALAENMADFLGTSSTEEAGEDGFIPGLPGESIVIKNSAEETLSEQERQIAENNAQIKELNDKIVELQQQISKMLDDAEDEATRIVEQAGITAENERERITEEYRQKGYSEGVEQLNNDREKLQQEFEAKVKENNEQYEKQVRELEPAFVELLIKYIEKLTGIYASERSEVILHVVHQALTKQTPCRNFIIRVSHEDYGTILNMKPEILLWVPEGSQIEVVEDSMLHIGDCLIETDSRIFDCGVDTQARSIIEDIRMLAGD